MKLREMKPRAQRSFRRGMIGSCVTGAVFLTLLLLTFAGVIDIRHGKYFPVNLVLVVGLMSFMGFGIGVRLGCKIQRND